MADTNHAPTSTDSTPPHFFFFYFTLWHAHPHVCTLRIYTHHLTPHPGYPALPRHTHHPGVTSERRDTNSRTHTHLSALSRLPCAIWLSSVISLRGCEGVCVCVCVHSQAVFVQRARFTWTIRKTRSRKTYTHRFLC